jgi:hypothetical protein
VRVGKRDMMDMMCSGDGGDSWEDRDRGRIEGRLWLWE